MKYLLKLLNPEQCSDCIFGEQTTLTTETFTEQVILCKRKDCDNWERSTAIQLDLSQSI